MQRQYVSQEEIIDEHNAVALEDSDDPEALPVIGWCPDWRLAQTSKNAFTRVYMGFIYNQYVKLMKKIKARLYVVKFEDRVEDLVGKIDGLIIPGGRDIDPKLYGEKNTASQFDKEDAKLRWDHCSDMITNLPKEVPILGICYGYEFLHCFYGGKMIQDLENADEHYSPRKFDVVPGTHLAKAIAPKTSMTGPCYHHQNIDYPPPSTALNYPLIVNSRDTEDGTVHGLELDDKDRTVFSVLWHIESCDRYQGTGLADSDANEKIALYLREKARIYRANRLGKK